MAAVAELQVVGKRFSAAAEVVALHDVSLVVEAGDHLAVVGPSGSGKSTLLNVLGLLERPTTGRYLLDGSDVADRSDRELARLRAEHIGFVFQAFHLIESRTIEENVELAGLYQHVDRGERRRRALEALGSVGLGHRLGFTPSVLSGGERQRVAVARALAARPRLLLCDEPTGNLDSTSTHRILDLIEAARTEEMAVVIITHDASVAARAARRVHLLDGELVGADEPLPVG